MLRVITRICPPEEEKIPPLDVRSAFNAKAFFISTPPLVTEEPTDDIIVRSHADGFFFSSEVITKLKSYATEAFENGWHKTDDTMWRSGVIGLIKESDQRKAASTPPSLYAVHFSVLGYGVHGVVHCGQNIESGELVAIKSQDKENEVEIKTLLKKKQLIAHREIARPDGSSKSYIIFPYVPYLMLKRTMYEAPSIGAMRFFEIIIKIGVEIQKLHRMGCLYNDLHLGNIMTNLNVYDEEVEIIDFGRVSHTADGSPVTNSSELESRGGLENFKPPEFLGIEKAPYPATAASDVYNFGLLISMMKQEHAVCLNKSGSMYTRLETLLVLMTHETPIKRPSIDKCIAELKSMFDDIRPVCKSIDTSELKQCLVADEVLPPAPYTNTMIKVPVQLHGADFVNVTDKNQTTTLTTQAKIYKFLLRNGLRIASQPIIKPTHTEEMLGEGTKLFSRYPRWGMNDEGKLPEVILVSVNPANWLTVFDCVYQAELKIDGNSLFRELQGWDTIADLKKLISADLKSLTIISIKFHRDGATFILEDGLTMRHFYCKYKEPDIKKTIDTRLLVACDE